MLIVDQGLGDCVLVLVFIGFYLRAALFVCRGRRMMWLQQDQLLEFTVKLEQQGTVRRRPTVRKQLVPSEAIRPRLDGLFHQLESN